MFRAYDAAPADPQLFDSNLREIVDNLTSRHQMRLSARDLTSLRYVYTRFFREGPRLNYSEPGSVDASMPTYADLMTQTDGNGRPHSYLASEERYGIVRKLEGDNLVIPVVGDFGGPTAIREVGRYSVFPRHDGDGILSVQCRTVSVRPATVVETVLCQRRRSSLRRQEPVHPCHFEPAGIHARDAAVAHRRSDEGRSTRAEFTSIRTSFQSQITEGRALEARRAQRAQR